MQLKPLWRAVPRSASLLVLAVLALVWTKTFLWAPLLLLAIFFFAVDVLGIHKRMLSKGESMEETPSTYGVLGDYVVDEAPSHGLFIRLCERAGLRRHQARPNGGPPKGSGSVSIRASSGVGRATLPIHEGQSIIRDALDPVHWPSFRGYRAGRGLLGSGRLHAAEGFDLHRVEGDEIAAR